MSSEPSKKRFENTSTAHVGNDVLWPLTVVVSSIKVIGGIEKHNPNTFQGKLSELLMWFSRQQTYSIYSISIPILYLKLHIYVYVRVYIYISYIIYHIDWKQTCAIL